MNNINEEILENEKIDIKTNDTKCCIKNSTGKPCSSDSKAKGKLFDQLVLKKNIMPSHNWMSDQNLLNLCLFGKYQKFNVENKNIHSGSTKRLKFTKEEDELLKRLVLSFGAKNWSIIASMMPSRTPRQCRDRYANYLAPCYIDRDWTVLEDQSITNNYSKFGPQWALISSLIPGRSPNAIKNRWKYHISKTIKINPPNKNNTKKTRRKRYIDDPLKKIDFRLFRKEKQSSNIATKEKHENSAIHDDFKNNEEINVIINDECDLDNVFENNLLDKENTLFNEENDRFQEFNFENDPFYF